MTTYYHVAAQGSELFDSAPSSSDLDKHCFVFLALASFKEENGQEYTLKDVVSLIHEYNEAMGGCETEDPQELQKSLDWCADKGFLAKSEK
jgi:hypothetical protein